MSYFDDMYGKGALAQFRKGCAVPGWQQVTIGEPHAGHLRVQWAGKVGTARCHITFTPDTFEWSSMVVEPAHQGFLTGLAKSLPQVLASLGVKHQRLSGGGSREFQHIGFDRAEGRWQTPTSRIIEYGDFAKGDTEPEWHSALEDR